MSDLSAETVAGLFARYADELKRFLRGRRGMQDAEDLVQEGFVRLLQNGAADLPAKPRAWLYRTCCNLAADLYDHARVRQRLHDGGARAIDIESVEDRMADPALQVVASDQLDQIWAALQRLPGPCRRAFLLNRLEKMSQREIARHLGISEKSVERYVLRALDACHAAVTDDR